MTNVIAYIGIGSNLDHPRAQVVSAVRALGEIPGARVSGRSSLYLCKPWGRADQPDFVNAAVRLDTSLCARQLLDELLAIEREAGRIRDAQRWGPRVLDLDLLAHGDETLDEVGLQVPHPRLRERAFVLLPLLEIDPNLALPGVGRLADRLGFVDCSGCERIAVEFD